MYIPVWLQRDTLVEEHYPIIRKLTIDLYSSLHLPAGRYEGRTLCVHEGEAAVCYKGYFRDNSELITRIAEGRGASESVLALNHIEHFLIFEHLPWIALPLCQTLAHATVLTRLITDYLRVFAKKPPLPIPVGVHEMCGPMRARYKEEITLSITPSAQINLAHNIDRLCAEGLAGLCYVSYHTGDRMAYLINRGDSFTFTKSILLKDNLVMSSQGAAPGAIQALRTAFAEIISLGYVFASPIHTGHCLQIHNLTTCGTFLDTDSILPLNGLNDTVRDRLIAYNVLSLAQSLSIVTGDQATEEAGCLVTMLRESHMIRLAESTVQAMFDKLSEPVFLWS